MLSLYFPFLLTTLMGCQKASFNLSNNRTPAAEDAFVFPDRFLFGQPDFGAPNSTVGTSQIRLRQPEAIWFDGIRVYLCDRDNRRLLIWNSYKTLLAGPEALNNPPDVVLQQADFDTVTVSATRTSMASCRGVFTVNNKLFVSDFNYHRVLVWNSIPTVSSTPPDIVIGQPDWTTVSSGTSDSKFNGPMGIGSDGTKLFIADRLNNRVLVWNTIPTISGKAADHVIGQPDLSTVTAGTSNVRLSQPLDVKVHSGKLYVADRANNRVLIWNSIPTVIDTPASFVVGHSDFTSSAANSPSMSDSTFFSLFGLMVDSTGLYVPDYGNSRLLKFSLPITSNGKAADWVIGQGDFTTKTVGTNEDQANGIIGVIRVGDHFIMSDQDNNRLISDLFLPHAEQP